MAQHASWTRTPHIKGSTPSQRMAMLTFSLIGLQFTWAVEMTYFTPYLLQLGLAKSQTALVWIAPPLSGLIVQPIIGTVSDSSRLRWGRRRPFMLSCSILVAIFLLTLAWAADVARVFVADEAKAKKATVASAIFCIYAVDFAINAVQATSRSLIVDTLPVSKQQLGSAWAGRMLGLGHVLGYLAGTVDLMRYFGKTLGASQFKQICVIASTILVLCVSLTCYCVEERVLLSEGDGNIKSGALKTVSTIAKTARHLPRKIQAVCWITFWSWIVYGSTWVGETYYRQDANRAAELKASSDGMGDIARKGALALVLFSFISFAGSIFLPWIVKPPSDGTPPIKNPLTLLAPILGSLRRFQPDITAAWGISQLAFTTSMMLAPVSHSFQFATSLIALCGIPWAMYGWAPLTIMGEEINKLELPANGEAAYAIVAQQEQNEPLEMSHLSAEPTYVPVAAVDLTQRQEGPFSDGGPLAGVYLGIWNIYATIPQFLATFISMIAFSILEPGTSPELTEGAADENGDDVSRKVAQGLSGTAVCLAIGAACSFVAATRTFQLRKM